MGSNMKKKNQNPQKFIPNPQIPNVQFAGRYVSTGATKDDFSYIFVFIDQLFYTMTYESF
jgi:hypothetical protein